MPEKILILGGTREANELASQLVAEGHDVTTSLAGRTKQPEPPAGKTRIGGFGGADGLEQYLKLEAIDRLIDATHPFARKISANAIAAANEAGIPLEIRTRKPWKPVAGDKWQEVPDLETARDALPTGARVLLALGSQHIDIFKTREDIFFLVRMVDPPGAPLSLPDHELVLGRPSMDRRSEQELLEKRAITHIVCRNSGGKGAYAKIEAARFLRLPVIMVSRDQPDKSE